MNQILDSQYTPYILSSQASYGVSIVTILDKFDHIITVPRYSVETLQKDRFSITLNGLSQD